ANKQSYLRSWPSGFRVSALSSTRGVKVLLEQRVVSTERLALVPNAAATLHIGGSPVVVHQARAAAVGLFRGMAAPNTSVTPMVAGLAQLL
ncbi:MAG TPA: hypothetical protein VIW27_10800, partial [Gammaproteobacteria bacterium]